MDACAVGKPDIAEEISGSGIKVPLGQDSVNTIKIGLTDLDVVDLRIYCEVIVEVPWDILSQIVDLLSQCIDEISVGIVFLGDGLRSHGQDLV